MSGLLDVRGVLDYVPLFRGRTFVLDLLDGGLPVVAMAEVLLDVAALHGMGVRLVVVVPQEAVEVFLDQAVEVELRVAQADFGQAGEVLDRGQVPVVAGAAKGCLSDEVVEVALSVGATKILCLLNGEGVLLEGKPVPAVLESEVAELLKKEAQLAGADLLARAAAVCQAGVRRVHLLDGRVQGVLVEEIFSNEGVGTMVHADAYREVRPLREEDIAELLAMVGRSMRSSLLVPRSYEEVRERAEDYLMMTVDGNVVGCVAVYLYEGAEMAEVACLFVKQTHGGRGYGQGLVQAAEQRARELGLDKVFALTTGAGDFFTSQVDYEPLDLKAIPLKRQEQLAKSGRSSLAFLKSL